MENVFPVSNWLKMDKIKFSLLISIVIILIAEINRSCVNDHDCILITNAKCSKNHRCVCKTNHVKTDVSECAPLLNEACINDEQCVPDNSVCIHNKCQCKFSYLQRSINKCVLSKINKISKLISHGKKILV